MIRRSMSLGLIPRSIAENNVNGLRDSEYPPSTYKLYRQQPDGTVVYIGEFPTPTPIYLRYNNQSKVMK